MHSLVLVVAFVILGSGIPAVYAASRTTPPAGSVVVNPSATTGQFSTLSSGVASLPNDNSNQTIFMFPGTYKEQVLVDAWEKAHILHRDVSTGNILIDIASKSMEKPRGILADWDLAKHESLLNQATQTSRLVSDCASAISYD